ncbi:MAG: nucleoside diphosphate kinase regulator [Myxococcota bacterium]
MPQTRPTTTAREDGRSANSPAITVSTVDYERLLRLIERHASGPQAALAEALDDELSRATVVDAESVPPDIVRMHSTCVFRFEDTREEREVTLVYPVESDLEKGRVSVLAPIGAALLGMPKGKSITWPTPKGPRRVRVMSVRHDPDPELSTTPPVP